MHDSHEKPNIEEGLKNEAANSWAEEKLNSYTNLKDPGVQNIGKEFEITYCSEDSSEDKTVRGVVIESKQAQIIVQDFKTGELETVNTNWDKISSIRSRIIGESPPNFIEVRGNQVFELLEQDKLVYGRCLFHSGAGNKRRDSILSGSFSLVPIEGDYKVIKLTDLDGREHLLDPNRKSFDFAVTPNKEDVMFLRSAKERIDIVDRERSERTELAKVLAEDPDILSNPDYYHYFEKDIPRAKELFYRWYGRWRSEFSIAESVSKIEDEFGPEYISALADPGVAQNFDEFFEFTKNFKKRNDTIPSSVELRKEFLEHLGRKTIYRGMMLTEAELARIKKEGITAPAFADKKRLAHILQETLDPVELTSLARHARDFYSEIFGRLTDFHDNENSTVLSVSGYKPVAESVGYHDSGQLENTSKHMYVFECEVPVASSIRMEKVFDYERRPETFLKIGDFEIDEEADLEVEMFIPYFIPLDSIKKIERVDTPPPKWVRTRKG